MAFAVTACRERVASEDLLDPRRRHALFLQLRHGGEDGLKVVLFTGRSDPEPAPDRPATRRDGLSVACDAREAILVMARRQAQRTMS